MEQRVNFALVGLFVLLLGGALIAAVLWLGVGTEQKHYETYVTYMKESVSGLNPRAPVKYRGVAVGYVRDIALDKQNPEQVRLLLDIEKGTPVKQDTKAILATQGITGIAYVELTGGSRDSPPLTAKPGQPYPEIPTGPSLLLRLDQAVSSLLQQLSSVATHLNEVAERVSTLLDQNKQRAIANTLDNVERLTAALAQRVDEIGHTVGHVDTILGNTAKVSAELPGLMNQVGDSVAAARQTIQTINKTANSLDQLVNTAQHQLSSFSRDTLSQVNPVLTQMQQLSEALRRLGQDLERNPNMLLFGRPEGRPGPGEK